MPECEAELAWESDDGGGWYVCELPEGHDGPHCDPVHGHEWSDTDTPPAGAPSPDPDTPTDQGASKP